MTRNIYYKQSDITASLSELMVSPWALECDSTRAAGIQEALHLIQDMINGEVPENLRLPAADVKPVVYGRWIKADYPVKIGTVYPTHKCSACDGWNFNGIDNFCPNCGAEMYKNEEFK